MKKTIGKTTDVEDSFRKVINYFRLDRGSLNIELNDIQIVWQQVQIYFSEEKSGFFENEDFIYSKKIFENLKLIEEKKLVNTDFFTGLFPAKSSNELAEKYFEFFRIRREDFRKYFEVLYEYLYGKPLLK